MLAKTGPLPSGPGWAYEFKWDGVRAIARIGADGVEVSGRSGRDITGTYPELQRLAEDVPPGVALDGEIVALDDEGRPDFGLLQSRMHVAEPSADLVRGRPVQYLIFDILDTAAGSPLHLPYLKRRELLDVLDLGAPPYFTGTDGTDVLETARQRGLEGVMAKRLDSPYRLGRRSLDWVKVPLLTTQEVVIGGWRPGQGRLTGTLGSLLIGAYDGRRLRYLGHVGTGFTAAALRDLDARLRPLARDSAPFDGTLPAEHTRDARWVEPDLVGEVRYRTRTADGLLRHAAWRGLRSDKAPQEVTV
ncbi:DNA ligase [Pseudonocardiaceae bacterium YIM PH 21723]|nr:DNA ligase [Pseudonocardiaceae bacterium YIM PH 21723]